MNISTLFACLAFFSSVVYLLLGLMALGYQTKENLLEKSWALSPFWALFPSNYNDFGKKVCFKGKCLLFFTVGLTVIWLLLK